VTKVERREVPRPTSLGARGPRKAARADRSQGLPRGVSQTPRRLPPLHWPRCVRGRRAGTTRTHGVARTL